MSDVGAPSQAEIDAFNARTGVAQIAVIEANAGVAEAEENLAHARYRAAAAGTVLAKLNVEGAGLQQRLQFAQAAAASGKLVVAGAVPGLRGR